MICNSDHLSPGYTSIPIQHPVSSIKHPVSRPPIKSSSHPHSARSFLELVYSTTGDRLRVVPDDV